jgi:hypothetical protein
MDFDDLQYNLMTFGFLYLVYATMVSPKGYYHALYQDECQEQICVPWRDQEAFSDLECQLLAQYVENTGTRWTFAYYFGLLLMGITFSLWLSSRFDNLLGNQVHHVALVIGRPLNRNAQIVKDFLNSANTALTEVEEDLYSNFSDQMGEEFEDSISHTTMKDPVRVSYEYNGRSYSNSYERAALKRWWTVTSLRKTDPRTNLNLLTAVKNLNIVSDRELRQRIFNELRQYQSRILAQEKRAELRYRHLSPDS